jgi:sugar lactone lactonase YvrE
MKIIIFNLFFIFIGFVSDGQTVVKYLGGGSGGGSDGLGDGLSKNFATISCGGLGGFDPVGNFIFGDGCSKNYIRKVDTSGIVLSIADCAGTEGYSGDGGSATAAEISYPMGFKTDSVGNIFFADSHNNRIRRIDYSTGIITTVAGTGTAGYSGNGGLATAAELNGPSALVFNDSYDLFVAEQLNNVVRKIDHFGVISTYAGTGVAGYNGDSLAATSTELNTPSDLSIDKFGNIYVMELGQRIRKIDTSGHVSTFAGNGTYGYSGDGGPATAAQFWFQWYGMFYDTISNSLFLCDCDNNRIRRVDSNGIVTTVLGNGSSTSTGDGALAALATTYYPTTMTGDRCGNIYFKDYSYTIREIIYDSTCSIPGTTRTPVLVAPSDFQVQPNPTNGVATVRWNGEMRSLALFDLLGRCILNRDVSGVATTVIDLSRLPASTYILEAVLADGRRVRRKVVKE